MIHLVASRYELRSSLGDGAYGSVHLAWDALARDEVAVKLIPLDPGYPDELLRVRREVSALRLLDAPGVVRLRDDGVYEGYYFMVMDRVAGQPFPGAVAPVPWSVIDPLAARLLTTLGHVHSAGVMHRDLKPPNILVTADGEVVVVDFGVSGGPSMGRAITAEGAWVGTPAYFSPEQIEGKFVDFRADLYAVGLILYEALTGELPHGGGGLSALVANRLVVPPVPVCELVDGVPENVSDTVQRLLATDPAGRPRDAFEALALLEVEPSVGRRGRTRWIGSTAAVDEATRRLRERVSVAIVGVEGSGRQRAIEEVCERLLAEGQGVTWLAAGTRPFESLRRLLPEGLDDLGIDAMRQRATFALGHELTGAVVAVRRESYLDRWSRELLAEHYRDGALITPIPELGVVEVALEALTREELAELVVGPDRLFHLQEDASRLLMQRTGGYPPAVVAEMDAWVHAGLATWAQDGRLDVRRGALDQLTGDLRPTSFWRGWVAPSARAATGGEQLGDVHTEICRWLAVAGGAVDEPTLARAMRRPAWEIEAVVRDLERAGAVGRAEGGAVALATGYAQAQTWSMTEKSRSHAAFADALETVGPARAGHLLGAGRYAEGAVDAAHVAEERLEHGHLGEAVAALDAGLLAARAADHSAAEERLLALYLRVACTEGCATRLDQALYETGRASQQTPWLQQVEALARAVAAVVRTMGTQLVDELGAVAPFADPELERWRHTYRLRASRAAPLIEAEQALVEARRWARGAGSPRALALYETWRGLHAYRVGDYAAAVAAQAAALASDALDDSTRTWALIDHASAALEIGRNDLAEASLAEALERASAGRMVIAEARATWVWRNLTYRRARPLPPDRELAEAAEYLARDNIRAVIWFTEAAFAWRAKEDALAADLAERARQACQRGNNSVGALLAAALEAAAAGRRELPESLGEQAMCSRVPGVALQALALATLARGVVVDEWVAAADSIHGGLPAERNDERLDVLTPNEALDLVRGGSRPKM